MTPRSQGFAIDLNKLRKFGTKSYRDGYLETRVRNGIARQVQSLRSKFGLSQTQFGDMVGKKQAVISRLEDPDNSGLTIKSLLDVARGTGVALLVQFVSYPEFLRRTADMSDAALQPQTIDETLRATTLNNEYVYELASLLTPKADQTQQSNAELLMKPPTTASKGFTFQMTTTQPSSKPHQTTGLLH